MKWRRYYTILQDFRLDCLEKAIYVVRLPDPQDRRGTLVRLTDRGLQFTDQAVEVHLRNEQRLVAGLSTQEREQLAFIFSRWLESFEPQNDN